MDLLGTATVFLAVSLSCLLFLSVWQQKHWKSKMPPGPIPLPFIGNLLQVDRSNVAQSLIKLSEVYGPVYTIHLGPRRIVVLSGYDAVKEALVDQDEVFSGRGRQATFNWLVEDYGVSFSNGERSKQLRRFSIMTLKNFGMGKRLIEDHILEEVQFLLEVLRSTNGKPFNPNYVVSRSVSNVICSILFGHRFDYQDPEFLSMLTNQQNIFLFISTPWGQLYDMFSEVMNYLPGPHVKSFEDCSAFKEFGLRRIEENKKTFDPNSPQNFIDCCLVKMQQEKENPKSEFCFKNILMTTLSILMAGSETISTTLRHGLLILMKYPEVAERIHEEIDRVVGRNRRPKMEDRKQMPFTNAVIHEIQRFADIIPLGMARCTIQDTQFRGYTIPKGTEVFPLLGSVMKDPKYFARPEVFDPQHFLDENGQFKKNNAFMPFSVGKRNCFGEPLARTELFLFLTSILQNFRLQPCLPPEEIDIRPRLCGFGQIPPAYQLCVIPQ